MKTIFLAAGCFWGAQHYLKQIRGVVETETGFANGNTENPKYEEVYTDTTGYAEAVRVVFDPAVLPLRKLLGNPVTKFLGGISMNYYLIHQTVIVHLKRLRFPPSVSDMPNMAGEQPWQNQYTLVSFALSLLLAILVTYAIEKPAARLLNKLRAKWVRSE